MLTSSINKDQITVVIPTLNEAEAIGSVLNELKGMGFDKILVVDGFSSDNTVEIAHAAGADVIQQMNNGKADAIKTAYNYINTEFMVVMDGDMSYDPKNIEDMMKIASFYDEVIIVRKNGRENISLVNRFGNKFLTKVFNLLMDANLHDALSGLYMVKTNSIREMNFESNGFGIEIEIASYITSTTRKVGETDGNYRKRVGNKKLRKTSGFSILSQVIVFAWKSNPAFIIFGISSLLIVPAAIILGWAFVNLLAFGINHYIWGLVGLVIGGVGITSLLLAIMALFIKRVEYRIISKSINRN